MHKLIATTPTENRTITIRVALTIATVFLFVALLWLPVTKMTNQSISVDQPQKSVEEGHHQRLRNNDHFGQGEQIIITHADSVKVSREAVVFQEFKREIALSTQDIDNSDVGVNGVIERLTSLKACLSLSYFMAKDFFTGNTGADKIFMAEVGELDSITTESVNKAKQAVDRLQTSLKMIEGCYTEKYVAGPERTVVATGLPESVIVGVPAKDMNRLELIKTISFDSSLGSASALLSSTALAKTVSRSSWKLFEVVEQKAAKRMAVAAYPAIVDGPLPVGDLVTLALEVGCLAWSFHEVYDAQGAMKDDLHRELTGAMKQNSKQIRDWAMDVGNELMETAALSMPAPKMKIAARTHTRR